MSCQFRIFAGDSDLYEIMDGIIDSGTLQLIIVWAIGVVAFFALWAILTKVVQRISRKKEAEKSAEANAKEPTEKPMEADSGEI